jgi:TRAP-type mannitol/chloroaromatic compound transport system permease large subunit
LPALLKALGRRDLGVARPALLRQLGVTLLPLALVLLATAFSWHLNTRPVEAVTTEVATLESAPMGSEAPAEASGGLQEPPAEGDDGLKEPSEDGELKAPPDDEAEAADAAASEPTAEAVAEPAPPPAAAPPAERTEPTRGWWIGVGVSALALAAVYALLTFQRLEVFKMLLTSFFPLVVLILAVLGSIVFGLATPTEAAAIGAFGGYFLAAVYAVVAKRSDARSRIFVIWLLLWLPALVSIGWFGLHLQGVVGEPVSLALGAVAAVGVAAWAVLAYRQAGLQSEVRESVFLTAKTSAMVCWLFVGSAIFSAAFALLGGQELVERWVMSMNLSKTEFLILSQVIIFILGWPLEWTEIIVIFMPIFIPLLDNFGVDPLFFGLLVALNLQTAFLSPPVAMAAFYLKGVSPPHVTLNQIFAGMLPFMGIQVVAIVLLYQFPAIGLWLPQVLYK